MTARVPLLATIAVLAFFAGITGVRLAYTLAYLLLLLLSVAFFWSRSLARSGEAAQMVARTRPSPTVVRIPSSPG